MPPRKRMIIGESAFPWKSKPSEAHPRNIREKIESLRVRHGFAKLSTDEPGSEDRPAVIVIVPEARQEGSAVCSEAERRVVSAPISGAPEGPRGRLMPRSRHPSGVPHPFSCEIRTFRFAPHPVSVLPPLRGYPAESDESRARPPVSHRIHPREAPASDGFPVFGCFVKFKYLV